MPNPTRPQWPIIYEDHGPSEGQSIAHNLAVVTERLDTIAERLDSLTAVLERISENLHRAAK